MQRRSALLVLLLVAPLALSQLGAATLAPPCAAPRSMDGVGTVCLRDSGLFEVIGPRGESLGYVHGTDPRDEASDAGQPIAAASSASPTCVAGAAGDYYVHAIYARASNDVDNYAATVATVRGLVASATQLVDDAAAATGGHAAIRVLCSGGAVVVENAVLPTPMASANFSTIVTDLRALGYTDGHEKYWVFYDDTGACTCSGTGHVYSDDRLLATNANNGNQAAMFAVDFGYNSVRTWMHEMGHNMGAVQLSAPHSSGNLHCNDGLDTMCYQDGGPTQCTSGFSCPGTCSVEVFDCGKDDYFNANPPSGNYLATHWNIGSRLDRFLDFGSPPPAVTSFSCAPSPNYVPQTVTCSFAATDDGPLFYTVLWGDGASTRVPANGTVASGATQTATHAWTAAGSYSLTLNATDANATSATRALTQTVWANAAPTMTTLTCGPASTFTLASCNVTATDDHGNLFYFVDWGDGAITRVPAAGALAPGAVATATHTWSAPGNFTVRANATDTGLPALTSADLTRLVAVARSPCVYAPHTDTLPLGLDGTQQEGVSSRTWADVPAACRGSPYTLNGSAAAVHDVDACWFAGATQIRCDNAGADESGAVPAGATKVVVVARLGVEVSYVLRIG